MPTLPQLKETLEKVLVDPDLKTEIYARPLRKDHLLTTGGRGVNAPQVTVRDAANLLIAILGNAAAIKGPETVKTYRDLRQLRRRAGPRGRRTAQPQRMRDPIALPLDHLRDAHYLGDLIEVLIYRAADGDLRRRVDSWRKRKDSRPPLTLRLLGPTAAAQVWIPMLDDKLWLTYALADDAAGIPPRGLCRATEIYEDTFLELGAVFAGG
jgi:hypothetical protein